MKTLLKTLTCSIALIGTSLTSFGQDPAGQCLQFNLADFQNDNIIRYVNCGNDNSLNPGDNVTMESWVKIQISTDNQKIFGKLNANFNSGFMMGIDQGRLYPEIWAPTQRQLLDGFIPPVPTPGFWIHLAVTYERNGMFTGYINGEQVGQIQSGTAQISNNTEDFIIGVAPWDLMNFAFFGELDEIRIWDVAKTQAEIRTSMFSELTGNEPNLVAYYDFNQTTGTTLPDLTPNGNDGTLVGLTANDWLASRAVLGNSTVNGLTDVEGFWNALSFSDPRSVVTSNGISIIASNIPTYDYLVMGHNNGTGVTTSDIPVNAAPNFNRLGREWYFNVVGSFSADLFFNLNDASGGGTILDLTQPAANYTLIERDMATGVFTSLKAGNSITGGVVSFDDVALSANRYYTVGVGDAVTGIDDLTKNNFNLNVFPNPSNGVLTFTMDQNVANSATVNVLNAIGEVVFSKELTIVENGNTIELEDIPAGMYFLKITTENGVDTKRFTLK